MLALPSTASAQTMPMKDGKVVYEFVDSSIISQKDLIHNRARTWVANNFRDANAVIQLDDKELGELIGKGNFSWGMLDYATCYFTVSVSSRDNKYRFRFYDIIIMQGTKAPKKSIESHIGADGSKNKKQQEVLDQRFKSLAQSITESLSSSVESDF